MRERDWSQKDPVEDRERGGEAPARQAQPENAHEARDRRAPQLAQGEDELLDQESGRRKLSS